MAYSVYLGRLLLPVTPERIIIKSGNKNKTITLINLGEVNPLRPAGLTSISFDALLPSVPYPFAQYRDGFRTVAYYLSEIEKLKKNLAPFPFIVSRVTPRGEVLHRTDQLVSLESYTIKEDAKEGLDTVVGLELKQYTPHGTVVATIDETGTRATVQSMRDAIERERKRPATHKTKEGDTLWGISRTYYGDESHIEPLREVNHLESRNALPAGQLLQLPR